MVFVFVFVFDLLLNIVRKQSVCVSRLVSIWLRMTLILTRRPIIIFAEKNIQLRFVMFGPTHHCLLDIMQGLKLRIKIYLDAWKLNRRVSCCIFATHRFKIAPSFSHIAYCRYSEKNNDDDENESDEVRRRKKDNKKTVSFAPVAMMGLI